MVHGCFFVVQQPPVESDTAMIRVNLHGDCFFLNSVGFPALAFVPRAKLRMTVCFMLLD